MRERGLKGAQKRRFRCTTDSRHTLPIAPNELDRNFDPSQPDRVWAGDVTYIATEEGWLYLAVMLDLFSRRVVGWSVSATNDTALASEALRRALASRRPRAGLLHHTDRGSPYAALAYTAILRQHGIIASMSRAGDCYDNAVVESFFGTLKAELIGGQVYPSRAVATASIADYIGNFEDPPAQRTTPEKAQECARSCPWPEGSAGNSILSSKQKRCASPASAIAASSRSPQIST
jgi:transposase InsO family protein